MIQNRELGIEHLEERLMLSGNVNVTLSGSNVVIRGDAVANQVRVLDNANGGITVQGLSGTQVNGQANGSFSTNSTTPAALAVNMRGGNDTVDFRATNVSSKAQIQMAGGDDRVLVNTTNKTLPRNLIVLGSVGDDCIKITNTKVGNRLQVSTAKGDDTMVIKNTDTKFLVFAMSSGNDRVKLDNVDVQRNSVMNLGPDTNQLGMIRSDFRGNTNVIGGNGSDLFGARLCNFEGNLIMNFSGGNDNVISDRTTVGTDSSDRFRLNLGAGNDNAASLGVTFRSNTVLDGGSGFDNGDSDDATGGEFVARNFESETELTYTTQINTLLAINC